MISILTRIERYFEFKTPLIWKNVFLMSVFHLLAIYGITLLPTAKFASIVWAIICAVTGVIGFSVGPHRLWTHKAYKAKVPMRIFIMLIYTLSGKYSIVQWVRDHRMHHKYTDTDADPHSSGRGLFFSHSGWLMMKRHPELLEKGKAIDLSDVWQDPVVRFHQKYFYSLLIVVNIIFPSAVAYYVFGETLKNVIVINYFFRYMFGVNIIWTLNSLGHYWGDKPYNKNIRACENLFVAYIVAGEGWHNFHHTFPWDYRIGECGQLFQFGAHLIEAFAWIGQAYDLKTASPELIAKVRAKQKCLPVNFEVPENGLTTKMIDADDVIKTSLT